MTSSEDLHERMVVVQDEPLSEPESSVNSSEVKVLRSGRMRR